MFDVKVLNEKGKIFQHEPTHDLGWVTGSEGPYYNSSKLAEYFENTLEKKYNLKGDSIVIVVDMKEKDDGKNLLHGKCKITVNGEKKEFAYDFRISDGGLVGKLGKLEHDMNIFLKEQSLSGNIYQTLNTNQ